MSIEIRMPIYAKSVNRNPLVKTQSVGGWTENREYFDNRNDALLYILAMVNYRREGYDYMPIEGTDLMNDDVITFEAIKRKTTQ